MNQAEPTLLQLLARILIGWLAVLFILACVTVLLTYLINVIIDCMK